MPISRTEAIELMQSTGSDLLSLIQRASALRDANFGNIVTYSRKVFIPLTNLCRDNCAYCTFVAPPNSPRAKTLTPDEVLDIARQGAATGCKEALFSLGEKPEDVHVLARQHLDALGYPSTHAYLSAMAKLVFEETGLIPHINAGVMTPAEIAAHRPFSGSMGLMLENISPRLLEKGEAHFGCIGKAPALRMETLSAAGKLRVPFTTGILIGIGETIAERVDSLFAIADMHAKYGHIQEVIIQNFRRKAGIRLQNKTEPSVADMLRTIGVARLIFGGEMSIQAPPNLTPDAYGLYLLAGINDWGGVSPVTADHINPEAAWPKIDELARVSYDMGFELQERLTLYPQYLSSEFASPHILARAQQLAMGD